MDIYFSDIFNMAAKWRTPSNQSKFSGVNAYNLKVTCQMVGVVLLVKAAVGTLFASFFTVFVTGVIGYGLFAIARQQLSRARREIPKEGVFLKLFDKADVKSNIWTRAGLETKGPNYKNWTPSILSFEGVEIIPRWLPVNGVDCTKNGPIQDEGDAASIEEFAKRVQQLKALIEVPST